MFKLVMTSREFAAYLREGMYSLRFAVLLLTIIILLFIVVQICEILYSFLRFQQNMENDKSGPTEVVVKDSDEFVRTRSPRRTSRTRSPRRTSRKQSDDFSKPSKEAVVQFSLSSEGSTASNRYNKEGFDEISMKILKSSSLSMPSLQSKSSTSSKNRSKKKHSVRKSIGKMQSASFSIKSDKPATEKELLVSFVPTDQEDTTQLVSGSTLSEDAE